MKKDGFGMKQLIWLETETMNESWVKFWRVFVGEVRGFFAFRWMEGVARVKAVSLKEIMFACN